MQVLGPAGDEQEGRASKIVGIKPRTLDRGGITLRGGNRGSAMVRREPEFKQPKGAEGFAPFSHLAVLTLTLVCASKLFEYFKFASLALHT
ncbi:hypothetical protein SAMN04488571_10641 [Methanoculleus thermophilus]|jgi:hypothetical protein|uniref:Uncharacterized protein n=1 Tax=Methanoculleus thermophilus TaxID=2200 RepID=A0A1G9AG23_9EURY|nr:hypothetical protein SAMN04488571_10641 [Methanoculleus thermophilus]